MYVAFSVLTLFYYLLDTFYLTTPQVTLHTNGPIPFLIFFNLKKSTWSLMLFFFIMLISLYAGLLSVWWKIHF